MVYTAIGRRKEAKAKVMLKPDGKGGILVNGLEYRKYFPILVLQQIVVAALNLSSLAEKFDIEIQVCGGGKRGQAEAARLGISRALLKYNPELKVSLRQAGFLTRDPRVKERKKCGLKRARKAPQWQKR